ncbi:MAG: hypothetical protein JO112_03435 [Planctomycetes bacterium]|nr:hypothetical protein [Planctomycetota bacterium]
MPRLLAFSLAALVLGWRADRTRAADPGYPPDPPPVWPSDPGNDRSGHFDGGAGIYLLKPYLGGNPALTATQSASMLGTAGTVKTTNSAAVAEFQYDASVSPRLWLGYTSATGLGGRVSWWHFDQSAQQIQLLNTPPASVGVTGFPANVNTVSSQAPLPGLGITSALPAGAGAERLSASSNLRLDQGEVAATENLQVGTVALLLSGGVQYLSMAQHYQVSRAADGSLEMLAYRHVFTGFGPVIAIEGRQSLGDTGLSFFSNAELSGLYGTSREQGFQAGVPSAAIPATAFNQVVDGHDHLIGFAEVQIGAEWAGAVGPARVFVQPALVGMVYSNAGTASETGGDIGFLGLSLTAGIHF